MEKILLGKKALITGANQGFGLEIAKKYVLAGADVVICARDSYLLSSAVDELHKLSSSKQKILSYVSDVSSESDVANLLKETLGNLGGCHVVVNNAGVYGPKGNIEEVDWLEWKKTIEINLYGSILICRAIIQHFKTQGCGKIIQLSGGGATAPLPRISAYAVSKAAIVRFVETIAEEVREFGIDINAIAPGALNTRMLDEVLSAGPEKVGKSFYERSLKQKECGGELMDLGAELALFLASSKSNGITGKLISAVWDNWKDLPEHLSELNSSDVYTLRRIVGRDRGFNWGDK